MDQSSNTPALSLSVRLRTALIWWDRRRKRNALIILAAAIPVTFFLAVVVEATRLAGFYGQTVATALLIVLAAGSPLLLFGALGLSHRRRLSESEVELNMWAEGHGLEPIDSLKVSELGETPILSGEAAVWPIFAWRGKSTAGAPYVLSMLGRRKHDRVNNVERVNGLTVVSAELPISAVKGIPALAVSLDTNLLTTGNPSDRCKVFLDRDANRARAAQLLSPEFLGWIDSQKQLAWEQRGDRLVVLDERLVTNPDDLDKLLAKARHIRDQYITSV